MPLHDLIIKTIAEYLVQNNTTLHKLIRLNKRFYGVRLYFIKNISLNSRNSQRLYDSKPEYWNYVCCLSFFRPATLLDLTVFDHVQFVVIEWDKYIIDVSPLSKIKHLELARCFNLEDVSPLRTVHDLTLLDCPKIRDVSALGKVHRLYIGGCDGIVDVSALATVYDLSFYSCDRIKDISALDKVPKLAISNCSQLPNFARIINLRGKTTGWCW